MRLTPKSFSTICLLVAASGVPVAGVAQAQPACAQIRAACQNAGFVQGAAVLGIGLQLDCMVPIVLGTPQRPWAGKPLPQVNPQVIAECAAGHRFVLLNEAPTESGPRPSGFGRSLPEPSRPNDHSRRSHGGGPATLPGARISMPEAELLERPAAPDCEFKSDTPADSDAALRAMKLDYEQQCYRQSEFILRARMERLQDAVRKTIESSKAEAPPSAK
jgi:hypothetical protein